MNRWLWGNLNIASLRIYRLNFFLHLFENSGPCFLNRNLNSSSVKLAIIPADLVNK